MKQTKFELITNLIIVHHVRNLKFGFPNLKMQIDRSKESFAIQSIVLKVKSNY